MIPALELGPELVSAGQALGLLDSAGNLDPNWFSDPLSHLETILSNLPQRDGLLQMLDTLLPPGPLPGLQAGEKWHPLLGEQPNGNLYLTARDDSSGVLVGLAGEFGASGSPPTARLRVRLPLVRSAGTVVSAVVGQAGTPLSVSLRVELGWHLPTQSIGLEAVSISASLTLLPAGSEAATVTVTLEKLQLDLSSPAQDTILDPDHLGNQATKLILGLVHANLSKLVGPTGEAAAVADHLMALFGIGNDIPPFPLAEGAAGLRSWLAVLTQGGANAPAKKWLSHLAGLLGSATTAGGTGAPGDPWQIQVLSLNANSGLELTLAAAEGQGASRLLPGLRVKLAPAGANPTALVLAQATLAAIPLAGSTHAAVLPEAAVLLRAPGGLGAPNLVNDPNISIAALQAGLNWDGTSIFPLLELEQVTFAGTPYERLNLTNTESVAAAASTALQNAIKSALGGPGTHLAALAGLIPPSNDPTSPHRSEVALLFTDPARAISTFHRQVLLDGAHDWSHLLAEVSALLGLTGAVSGTGSPADPWRVSLGTAGPLDLALAVWDSNTGGAAGDPHGLRLGLHLAATQTPLSFAWLAEVLSFDLPASGAGPTRVLGAQHILLRAQPVPTFTGGSGLAVSALSFEAGADWLPGSPVAWHASVNGLSITAKGSTTTIPTLAFPLLGGFDVANPAATAAALGVPVPDLERLLRLLLSRAAYNWGGMPGFVLAGLAGLHDNLSGMPSGWPILADPAGPGSVLSDLFAALQAWLGHAALDTAPDGQPYLPTGLAWLWALLSGHLPASPIDDAPSFRVDGYGSGTYEDPWALPLDDLLAPDAEALVWLEPAGPPPAWAAPLAAQSAAAGDFLALARVLVALSAFDPRLRGALAGYDPGMLANALNDLAAHFSLTDGVVPLASQIPTGGSWTAGTAISAAHPSQPQDPSAISQILAQVDEWAGGTGGPRAALLLGPAFSDHHAWDALLASPQRHGSADPAAHFNLRLPGVDPATIDLSGVTTVGDYYTADLQDDGSGNLSSLTAQVERVAARIGQLRPGVPLTLVAHSTTGLPARAFAAAAATGTVQGLITLGTPHLGAPLPFLTDPMMAGAVRVAQVLLPDGSGADATRQALSHLIQALDGYLPPDVPGHLPQPMPYPVDSFNMGGGVTDTGGRPALALGGSLTNPLLQVLKDMAGALSTTIAAPVPAPPAPTHLAFGFRARLGYPPAEPGQVAVDARLCFNLLRVPLRGGTLEPPRPAHALRIRAALTRPNGWLAGAAGAYAGPGQPNVEVRVRWAELGADLQLAGSTVQVTPILALHQAAFHGPMSSGAAFSDPQAQALLGAVLQVVTATPPKPGSTLDALFSDLRALGVVVPDSHGGLGVSADAFAALATDAAGYLRTRFSAILDSPGGLGGLHGPSGGPWRLDIPSLPIQVSVERSPGAVRLSTPGFPIAPNTRLAFNAHLSLPGFALSGDADLSIGAFGLVWDQASGQLALQAGCLGRLPLHPAPSAADLHTALNDLLPRLLFSSAAAAALEAAAGQELSVGPLDCFFAAPGQSVARSRALGNGTGMDAGKITALLQAINRAIGMPAGPGLSLPGGLQFTAAGSGTDVDPLRLTLATTGLLGGVLGVQLGVAFDSRLHPTPTGGLTLDISGLPAAVPLNWTGVTLAFGISPVGATLTITPHPGDPIQVLPRFGGLGSLVGTAQALLPAALDAAVDALGTPGPQPELLRLGLRVATDLGLYDPIGKFSAHNDKLRALLKADWTTGLGLNSVSQGQVASAIAGLFTGTSPLSGAIPGTIGASGTTVTWSFPLPAPVGSGSLAVALGWDGSGPSLSLGAQNARLANGALECGLVAGYSGGAMRFSAQACLHLQASLGLDVVPQLAFSLSGGRFAAWLLPLAAGSSDGPVRLDLAPTPSLALGPGGARSLVESWLLPLAADLLLEVARPHLSDPLWIGGKTLREVLEAAGLVVTGSTPAKLNHPLPDWLPLLTGLATELAKGIPIPLSSTLQLSFVSESDRLGVGLRGRQEIPAGDMMLGLNFGAPASWGSGADEGLVLYLFQTGGSSITFNPGLHLSGVGLGLAGADDAPLINTGGFRLGELDGYLFLTMDFEPSIHFEDLSGGSVSGGMPLGGGLVIKDLGLPLGQATGGNLGGDNPVAASLLRHDSGAGGDNHPVNPGIESIEVWDIDGKFSILFGGNVGPIWIGVHAGFGPIYIDQVGLAITPEPSAELLLDGSVKVAGLTVQADDLTVIVPFNSLASPGNWRLDLKGLGVGFQSPGVDIAGALRKSDGPPVEYDGLLLVQLNQFGIVAIGAYSTPGSGADRYTSLFVFAGVFIPIGWPPLIEISGLGLGLGYNRELIVPDDLNQLPGFVLVAALDDPGKIADDPMGMLMQIRGSIPAKRGSFWLAVGLRGTSFEIVHVTAIVYVALDRGVEVGLLGVARMALPADDTALVSVELALKARFSTAEGLLSIQAQLTDNSWLISPDVQLTGGFAYFMWFPKAQFVLTLGGYHPAFQRPPEFPTVPRLGYHWSLLGAISIKGESYFALTNTCVMVGTRFEATYGPDWIQVWFTAYVDFLVSWDPFFYKIQVGVEVGARFRIEVCFIACATIDISVSLGATLFISGPPFHGTVTVDLEVASVTVPFGPEAIPQPDFIQDWNVFALKYLNNGDPNTLATANHALTGLLPPDPPGGQPSPGTQAQPWKMTNEFSFLTETRMPAIGYRDFLGNDSGKMAQTHDLAINPMGKDRVSSMHLVGLDGWDAQAKRWVEMKPGASDVRFRVSADHFHIDPVIGQVSEATWSFIDPANVPAAARTISELLGLRVTGFAVAKGQSALIPIAKLVDDGHSRPLPFASEPDLVTLKHFGELAEELVQLAAGASGSTVLNVARQVLVESSFFGQVRQESGLSAQGLRPMAARALSHFRSAPPLMAPMTTGLTMKPVGQAAPPTIARVADQPPVALEQPRLRAVLQGQVSPASDAPPALHTTVVQVAPRGAPRMITPRLDALAGARLQRVAAPNAPRPTALGRSGRTLRSSELGWAAGPAHQAALRRAEQAIAADGVTLASGVTHIWDLPDGPLRAVVVGSEADSAQAGVRVTFLSRGGQAMQDVEFAGGQETQIPAPEGCAMLAFSCLGRLPGGLKRLEPGLGALSQLAAPTGQMPICGWQNHNLVAQVGAAALLARGAVIALTRPFVAQPGHQPATQAIVRAADVLAGQTGAETWLPTSTQVVMVLLDQQDPSAAQEGDLSLAVQGVELAEPLRVVGGRRVALFYDVTHSEKDIDHITIAAASRGGWSVSGVVGLSGRAQEWAVRLNGGIPEHFVPDGPLTPDGRVTVRLVMRDKEK